MAYRQLNLNTSTMDYHQLKSDKKLHIPTYDALMPIVLDVSRKENCDCRVEDIKDGIEQYYFHLPQKMLQERIRNGRPVIAERLYFSCWFLTKDGLLTRPYPATYRITQKGLAFLKKHTDYTSRFKACVRIAKQIQSTRRSHKSSKPKNNNSSKTTNSSDDNVTADSKMSFPDHVEQEVNTYNKGLRSRLLGTIFKKDDPFFFEQLVVDLLAKMGYAGADGNAIRTQSTNDGGIDGIISADPLGVKKIFLQAKMYNPKHSVGRPEIQQFCGSLHGQRGVFITTSNFNRNARKEARSDNIIMIDGKDLTNYMLKYRVGVQVRHTYQILNIDKDYFD